MRCPHCGQTHPAGAHFCPETGRLLAPAPPPPRYAQPGAPTAAAAGGSVAPGARRSSRLLVMFAALGLCGLGLIAGGVWQLLTETLAARATLRAEPSGVWTPTVAASVSILSTATIAFDAPTLAPAATEPLAPIPPTITPTDTPLSAAQSYPATPLRGRIVFTCFDGNDDEICLMNANGSGLAQLTDNSEGDFYASLSHDGRSLLFARQISGSNYEIFRMSTDGSGVTQLTFNGGGNFAPAYSPDGSLIAFTSTQGGDGQQIWVMDSGGGFQQQLTTEGINEDPSWSADGRQIAFASSRSGSTQIWVMNSDGSSQRRITNVDDVGGRNSWSPDGRALAFYAGRREDRSRNIYLIGITGGEISQLTFDGDNLAPSFSPDGGWIAFTSYRDGDNDIYVMRPDGTNAINLTQNSGSDYQPRWGP